MNTKGRMAAAVGLGYLLGRTHRTKLVLMLAAAGAARGVRGGPPELIARAIGAVRASPELTRLGESVRGELLDAAKAAAVTAAGERIESLNNRLLIGTEAVGGAVGDVSEHVGGTVTDVTDDVGNAVADVGANAVDTVGDVLSGSRTRSKRARHAEPAIADDSDPRADDDPSAQQPPIDEGPAVGRRARGRSSEKRAPKRQSAARSKAGRGTLSTRSQRRAGSPE